MRMPEGECLKTRWLCCEPAGCQSLLSRWATRSAWLGWLPLSAATSIAFADAVMEIEAAGGGGFSVEIDVHDVAVGAR